MARYYLERTGLKLSRIPEPFLPVVIFGLVTAFVCWNLLHGGYLLTRDMFIFHPNINFSTEWYGLDENSPFISRLPILLAIDGLASVTSVEIVQKTIISSSFFISGISMYYLAPGRSVGKLFAGVLYSVNPFIYSHLIAGQWALILAFALTPLSIKIFLKIIKKNRIRDILLGSLIFSICGFFQIHWFFLQPVIFISLLVPFLIFKKRGKKQFKSYFVITRSLIIFSVITAIINLFWVLPYLFGNHSFQYRINHIDFYVHSFKSFYTENILLEFLFMRGFWLEPELYGAGSEPNFNWLVAIILALLPFVLFISKKYQKQYRFWIISSFTLFLISTLLAIGYANPITKYITERLVEIFPPYAIFRDTQKWTSVLVFAFCLLSSISVTWVITVFRSKHSYIKTTTLKKAILSILIAFIFCLPFINSYQLLILDTQLRPTKIPDDWLYAQEYLQENKNSSQTLILPWQPEIPFHWINSSQNWLGPIERTFFPGPILKAEHHEFYDSSNSPSTYLDKFIKETVLTENKKSEQVSQRLTMVGVKHILLLHEDNYGLYRTFLSSSDLKLVVDLPTLSIYENEQYLGRAMEINVNNINDSSAWKSISSTEISPVTFDIGNIKGTMHWIFTSPQKTNPNSWHFENIQPKGMVYNFIPFYESNTDSGRLLFQPYNGLRLFGYIASLAGAAIAISLLIGISIYESKIKSKKLTNTNN